MGKLTWQQLGLLFGGSQFNAPEEAAKLLADAVFTKIGKLKGCGKTRDCRLLDEILYRPDKLAKNMENIKQYLYKSGAVKDFQYMAKIKWKSYKTFRNDFIKFNKLPMFKNTPSGHGTKLREAAEKKLAAKAKKEAQRKLLTKLIK